MAKARFDVERALEMYENNIPINEIAREVGAATQSISAYAKRHGWKRPEARQDDAATAPEVGGDSRGEPPEENKAATEKARFEDKLEKIMQVVDDDATPQVREAARVLAKALFDAHLDQLMKDGGE